MQLFVGKVWNCFLFCVNQIASLLNCWSCGSNQYNRNIF